MFQVKRQLTAHIFALASTALLVIAGGVLSYRWTTQLNQQIDQNYAALAESLEETSQIQRLHQKYAVIEPLLNKVDRELPGLSTDKITLLQSDYRAAVVQGNYTRASETLDQLDVVVKQTLARQDELATRELARLSDTIEQNRAEIKSLLGDTSVVPVGFSKQLNDDSVNVRSRLQEARDWLQKSSAELRRRKDQLTQVQKKILIDKSDKTLYILEDEKTIYQMPISTGRVSAPTRVGEYEILDKLGTVWSVWDIWLPYWMGIYFAGSTENGIHGLPYDNAGNTYWKDSIGKYDMTYGCVMPNNENMKILYNWAEVGTPVTIRY